MRRVELAYGTVVATRNPSPDGCGLKIFAQLSKWALVARHQGEAAANSAARKNKTRIKNYEIRTTCLSATGTIRAPR